MGFHSPRQIDELKRQVREKAKALMDAMEGTPIEPQRRIDHNQPPDYMEVDPEVVLRAIDQLKSVFPAIKRAFRKQRGKSHHA